MARGSLGIGVRAGDLVGSTESHGKKIPVLSLQNGLNPLPDSPSSDEDFSRFFMGIAPGKRDYIWEDFRGEMKRDRKNERLNRNPAESVPIVLGMNSRRTERRKFGQWRRSCSQLGIISGRTLLNRYNGSCSIM
jgi:hypothetical protein